MKSIWVILLFWTSHCVSQTVNSSDKIKKESGALFEATGYPSTGDIPVLNRKNTLFSIMTSPNFKIFFAFGNLSEEVNYLTSHYNTCVRIFRGTRVSIREHPYVVSIRRRNSHYLTGTLITRNLVLTVAHPLISVPVYELRIVVGENYSDRGTSLLTVILVVIHQNFDPYTLAADIAMLRFYEDVVFKSSIKSVSLIIPKMPLIDTTGFVTGWGRCDFTENELCLPRASEFYPDEIIDPMLRTVSVNIASANLYCEGYIRHGIKLYAGMLCAGVAREEYPSFACSAVPGAPLVVHGKLAGILSWGFGCGYAHDLPLVYTSVQYHTKWIAYNIMLLRKLSKNDLTPLFQATKSYIVIEWLSKTRISKPLPHEHVFYKNIQQMPFDLEMVKLLGNTYDVRDFLNDGEVHLKKSEMYEEIKKDLEQNNTLLLKKKMNQSLSKQTVKTYPFINQQSLLNANFNYDSASDNEY